MHGPRGPLREIPLELEIDCLLSLLEDLAETVMAGSGGRRGEGRRSGARCSAPGKRGGCALWGMARSSANMRAGPSSSSRTGTGRGWPGC
jgi:hypothetical protein